MDVRFINPFIVSSRRVFDMMIHLPLTLGKPQVRTYGTPNYTVSAIIGLGGAVTGCVVLGFSQQVALALASGLTQKPQTAVDSDAIDALGEIINMIAGAAKKDLPGGLATLSVPNVILGSHKIEYPSGTPIIILPCTTTVGAFTIEVAIRLTDSAATSNASSNDASPVTVAASSAPTAIVANCSKTE